MLNYLPLYLIASLLLTEIIETPLAAALGVRSKKGIANVILINAVTNPIVVLLNCLLSIRFGNNAHYVIIACLELFALISEWLFYRAVLENKKPHPFLLSFLLNLASYLTGVFINYFIL